MKGHIEVTNWEEYQHYKDRNPIWIKLYSSLLDDYEFTFLPDASKWHLVGIFLLAGRYQNRIPNDPKWLGKQLSCNGPVDVDILVSSGFITLYQDDSNTLAKCLPREEKNREDKEKSRKEYNVFVEHFEKVTGRAVRSHTQKRLSAFNARLEDFSVEEMCKAVDNAADNDYLRGANDNKRDYLTIDYILRADKMEEWLHRLPDPVEDGRSRYGGVWEIQPYPEDDDA